VVTTVTSPVALPAGAVAVMLSVELTVKDRAAAVPNVTADTPEKSVPVISTDVPPSALNDVGEMT
jgi:hypothetical protein